MTDELSRFELTFRPSTELISAIRRFVMTMYARVPVGSDLADQIAMTTHELLENAAKYSIDGMATLRMEVGSRVSIITRNRVREDDAARVSSCLAELERLGDPQTYYMTLMKRARRITQSGGLGLGRIAAEGDMQLSMTHEGDVLQLEAVHRGVTA